MSNNDGNIPEQLLDTGQTNESLGEPTNENGMNKHDADKNKTEEIVFQINSGPMSEGIFEVSSSSSLFNTSQTIFSFMLCLCLVGLAFFISGILLYTTESSGYLLLSIVCTIFGFISLSSSFIYLVAYIFNECTNTYQQNSNRFQTTNLFQSIINDHDITPECENNCFPSNGSTHQDQSENVMINGKRGVEQLSFLNVDDLGQTSTHQGRNIRPSKIEAKAISSNSSNVAVSSPSQRGKRRTSIVPSLSFCSSHHHPFMNKYKSDSKSQLLFNEQENENMLFDVDNIDLKNHSRSFETIDNGLNDSSEMDSSKIVIANGDQKPFVIVKFNKTNHVF